MTNNLFRCALITAFIISLQGCTLFQPTKELQIKGGGFRNLSAHPIEQVELKVKATGTLISCSYISPKSFFATQFPQHAYQQNAFVIKWNHRGTSHTSSAITLPLPKPIPDEPVMAVICIDGTDVSSARFIPVSQTR